MATVRDLCKGEVIVIDTSASIEQAAVLMDRKSVGFLVVSNREGIPVGVVTDRDISTRAVGRALDVASVSIQSIVSANIVSLVETSSVYEALNLMARHQIRRLIVTDQLRNFVGVISSDDILRYLVGELGQLASLYSSQAYAAKINVEHDFSQMA